MLSTRLGRAAVVAAVFAIAFVMPTTADTTPPGGNGGAVVTIRAVYLMNAVTIDIHADVTCNVAVVYSENATGQITQASAGRRVAHGYAFTSTPGVVCDNQSHEMLLRVVADPGGTAFKSGAATAQVNFQACSNYYNYQSASGDTGPVSVRVKQWPNKEPWPALPMSPPLSPPLSGAMSH